MYLRTSSKTKDRYLGLLQSLLFLTRLLSFACQEALSVSITTREAKCLRTLCSYQEVSLCLVSQVTYRSSTFASSISCLAKSPTFPTLPTCLSQAYGCSDRYTQVPAATLSTWRHQKYSDRFSFPYFCSISSWIRNSSAAVLPQVPPFVPLKALFSSRHTIYGLPTTLPLTYLIIPHCQSRRSHQFPSFYLATCLTSSIASHTQRSLCVGHLHFTFRVPKHPTCSSRPRVHLWWAHPTCPTSRTHLVPLQSTLRPTQCPLRATITLGEFCLISLWCTNITHTSRCHRQWHRAQGDNGDDEGEGEPNNHNGHNNVIRGGGDGSDFLLHFLL